MNSSCRDGTSASGAIQKRGAEKAMMGSARAMVAARPRTDSMAVINTRSAEVVPMPVKIKRRLRYYCIKNVQDAFWIEEAEVNGIHFDQLTVDLSSWFVRGFEVKVSRADFVQDLKWQNYLPYVNQFF